MAAACYGQARAASVTGSLTRAGVKGLKDLRSEFYGRAWPVFSCISSSVRNWQCGDVANSPALPGLGQPGVDSPLAWSQRYHLRSTGRFPLVCLLTWVIFTALARLGALRSAGPLPSAGPPIFVNLTSPFYWVSLKLVLLRGSLAEPTSNTVQFH